MSGFRKAIDKNCKNCIYDPGAAGTWHQQVTLCSARECPFYDLRPITKSKIPRTVLSYHQISEEEYQPIPQPTLRGPRNV